MPGDYEWLEASKVHVHCTEDRYGKQQVLEIHMPCLETSVRTNYISDILRTTVFNITF